MRRYLRFLTLSLYSLATPLFASTPPSLVPLPGDSQWQEELKSFELSHTARYQLGSEWGKKPIKRENLADYPAAFQRAALATLQVGGATGFYLGVFNGHHLVATNHHVLPSAAACLGRSVSFALLEKSFTCTAFLGHWTAIDLALFAIAVKRPEDAAALKKVGRNFSFHEVLTPGQQLLTLGFGVAANTRRELMGTLDSDCKVFSQPHDYRFMKDPDQLNPGPYKAWSFALGCDVSHGDSGSAIVDRNSGAVVGIIWTGRIPKEPRLQDSEELTRILQENREEDIWNELNYAVPAAKIHAYLQSQLDAGHLKAEAALTIRALLSQENSGREDPTAHAQTAAHK